MEREIKNIKKQLCDFIDEIGNSHSQLLENNSNLIGKIKALEENNKTHISPNNFGLINHGKLMEEAIFDAINFFNKSCPFCGIDLYKGNVRKKIEIDHFIPISKGGQDFPWNILPVCRTCNRSKKDKMPYEFLKNDIYEMCKEYLSGVLLKITSFHEDKLQREEIISNLTHKLSQNEVDVYDLIKALNELYRIEGDKIPMLLNVSKQFTSIKSEVGYRKQSPKQKFMNIYSQNININKKHLSLELGVSRTTIYKWITELEQKKPHSNVFSK